jgi:hypothetical protein
MLSLAPMESVWPPQINADLSTSVALIKLDAVTDLADQLPPCVLKLTTLVHPQDHTDVTLEPALLTLTTAQPPTVVTSSSHRDAARTDNVSPPEALTFATPTTLLSTYQMDVPLTPHTSVAPTNSVSP